MESKTTPDYTLCKGLEATRHEGAKPAIRVLPVDSKRLEIFKCSSDPRFARFSQCGRSRAKPLISRIKTKNTFIFIKVAHHPD